ncbi:hypothetical protein K439DRAFT_1623646 [Ramaria rubella]|nr:hypothetical protein K439DRAFT_1623646 [Ramaria rubella]
MSTAFMKYTTPGNTTHFSEKYFTSLSFSDTVKLSLPMLLRFNALDSWSWIEGGSIESLKTVLTAGEYVPTREDPADILNGMEEAYQEGIRGVELTLSTPLGKNIVAGHLSLVSPHMQSLRDATFILISNPNLHCCHKPHLTHQFSTSGIL